MKILCECNSYDCKTPSIDVPLEEVKAIHKSDRQVIILKNCRIGPELTDELVEKREKYYIYKEI